MTYRANDQTIRALPVTPVNNQVDDADDESLWPSNSIRTRTRFPETWLWENLLVNGYFHVLVSVSSIFRLTFGGVCKAWRWKANGFDVVQELTAFAIVCRWHDFECAKVFAFLFSRVYQRVLLLLLSFLSSFLEWNALCGSLVMRICNACLA